MGGVFLLPPRVLFPVYTAAKGPFKTLSSLSAIIFSVGLCDFPEPSPPRLPHSSLWGLAKAGNRSWLPTIVHMLPFCARGRKRANRNQVSRNSCPPQQESAGHYPGELMSVFPKGVSAGKQSRSQNRPRRGNGTGPRWAAACFLKQRCARPGAEWAAGSRWPMT